jgi:hypothetical protein
VKLPAAWPTTFGRFTRQRREDHGVADEVLDGIAAAGPLGVAVAALAEGEGGQQRQQAAEGEP